MDLDEDPPYPNRTYVRGKGNPGAIPQRNQGQGTERGDRNHAHPVEMFEGVAGGCDHHQPGRRPISGGRLFLVDIRITMEEC